LEKLFRLNFSQEIVSQNGPFTIRGAFPTFHYFTSPVVAEGVLYFTIYQGDAYFYAVDTATGKQIVTLKFDSNDLSYPIAMGRTVFFGTDAGSVYAYDVTTQTKKWMAQTGASFGRVEPVMEDGMIYICGSGAVFALAADTGKLSWTYIAEKSLSGPAVQGDYVVVLSDKTLIAIDKKTGLKKWEISTGRDFFGPSILDDQIFVRHVDGEVRAYALRDGALRWKSKKEGGAETALALSNGAVIYGEEFGNLVALDARTGLEKWRFKTKQYCANPLVAGATVYSRCKDHFLYAVDAQTGALKWRFDTKGSGRTPVIANGVLYSLSSDGVLQALR
jgi:eukaryotic-like serine/threonine-protein kinase